MKRIAIIGAGPIGLEAALAALERGYAVDVFERGAVADSMSQWGHVRLFSPFEMNASARGVARLHLGGVDLPRPHELVTGAEFRSRYLLPLARCLPPDVLHERTEVVAIARAQTLKGDHIGDTQRNAKPFRLLVRQGDAERTFTADIVFDCSGTYGQPNPLGDGGIPVPGERLCAERIHYGIPDVAGDDRTPFAGQRVLVVGGGHSAATAVCNLACLDPKAEIHWLVRRERAEPAEEIANDPLPERARLSAKANSLERENRIALHRAASIEALEPRGDGLQVQIANGAEPKTLEVDRIVVATGFRPDLSFARELQLQTCWATEGTYPLAASLLGEAGADCLTTPAFGADMLKHPEPGFFTLGMKSYGRSPNFLLRTGYEQIESVLDWLEKQEPA